MGGLADLSSPAWIFPDPNWPPATQPSRARPGASALPRRPGLPRCRPETSFFSSPNRTPRSPAMTRSPSRVQNPRCRSRLCAGPLLHPQAQPRVLGQHGGPQAGLAHPPAPAAMAARTQRLGRHRSSHQARPSVVTWLPLSWQRSEAPSGHDRLRPRTFPGIKASWRTHALLPSTHLRLDALQPARVRKSARRGHPSSLRSPGVGDVQPRVKCHGVRLVVFRLE
jgi:hypothetical protein